MNKREGAIVGAFTGILCGDFSDLHEYIEELLGRPVFTHELGNKDLTEEIKVLAKPDFVAMAESVL
ncbi:MAG: hypothetical protein KUG64_10855 [Cycloclasticus sp.]|nr:hypothetical protein [Cycloclasticus sp.]